jgi:putative nucleotidyltransferase with HDIG domain
VSFIHYVGVSFYAALVARRVGIEAPAQAFTIAIGGLLHDIGAEPVGGEKAAGAAKELLDEGEAHPERGARLLSEIAKMPDEVVRIVREHHEHPGGVGFPQGLSGAEIHGFARLVAVVDEFCHLVLRGAHGAGLDPEEALTRLLRAKIHGADRQFFEALVASFGLKIDEKLGILRPA